LPTLARADDPPAGEPVPPAAVAPAPAAAAPAAPALPIEIHAFVSSAWVYNFNQPTTGTNAFRAFDFDHNSIKVDVAELVLLQAASKPGDWGFRVDFEAGASIPKAEAAAGLFRDASGVGSDFDLQQAFGSYIAPLGEGLRIDVGKWGTHIGAEVIEGYDGYNDNYSHSFLFAYGPYTHTGLKLTYPFSSTVAAMVEVVNGWDNVKDNNDGKSIGFQLALTPAGPLTAYINYIGGPERAGNSDFRHLGDLVLVLKPIDIVAITVNGTLGFEKNGAPSGSSDATWWGIAATGRATVHPLVDVALRGEIFKDEDGNRTGLAQRLIEVTLTSTFRLGGGFVVRPELRIDNSDVEVFATDNESDPSKTQVTFAINVLVAR
jgi:hypothetical protein